jgi:MFS family permease
MSADAYQLKSETDMNTTAQVERSAIRKVCVRLVPFIALMFFINFLDRTAISFAGPNGLTNDLGLTAAQFGFAAGVFFVGYILLEIPSNLALHRFGARRWMARIMVTWGIVALLFTWVASATELYWLRFLLGVAEAGFFPGAILFLSMWVPSRYRSKVLSLFYLAQPLTIVIGAPVAALLMQQHGTFDLAGWRLMFFGVAIPAIIVGVVAWFYLTDRPADAKWLTSAEKKWLIDELATEASTKTDAHNTHAGKALLNGRVWVLCLIYFGLVYGLYALAFFLPTIIGGFEAQFGTKFNVFEKGLITAIPYLPAAVALYFWSRDATQRGVRSWHIALPALIGALSVPIALYMQSPAATVAAITVTACAIFSALPNFWAVPGRFLSGAGAAAGIALINTVGNFAGFAAPFITGAAKDATGSYHVPMFIVGGFMLISAIAMWWFTSHVREESPRTQTLTLKPGQAFR